MSVAADAGRHDARLFEVSVPGAQQLAHAREGITTLHIEPPFLEPSLSDATST